MIIYLKGVELLQTKQMKAVVEKTLCAILFENMNIIWRKLKWKKWKKNQRVLAQVARESVSSILNVARLELVKNRGNINWLISNMRAMKEEAVNISETMTTKLQELNNFIQ